MKKYITKILIQSLLIFGAATAYSNTVSAYVLYESKQTEVIGKNITYEKIRQATEGGLRDIHILRAPIGDEYIKIKPVQSAQQYSLKESTTKILQDNGAIAGINGDFFNMSGSHSSTIGIEVKDSELISIDILNNMYRNEYGAFFVDNMNNPFIEYLNIEIDFLNDGQKNINIFAINKITDMAYSVCIDRNYMTDTSLADRKFPNLTKIVVENDIITYISEMGETVEVPENGYVILVSEASAEYQTSVVKVGQQAQLKVYGNFNIDALTTAIGGAGKILENGQIVNDGAFVPSGRNPRTVIGFSADRKELILVVVDGRNHSIGATHTEIANLMVRLGAVSAMHLDGGGSSTMGVRTLGESSLRLVNTPSEGSQRRVANVLGIFNEAPLGDITSIIVQAQSDRVFKDTGMPINIFGTDGNLNVLPVTESYITSHSTGTYQNGYFYPSELGNANFGVTFSDGTSSNTQELKVLQLAEIIPDSTRIITDVGLQNRLSFSGKSEDGFSAYIYTGLNYEVFPNTLGRVVNDTFIADSIGSGFIKCWIGDIVTYVGVSVASQELLITSFENDINFSYLGYPETALGSVSTSSDFVNHLGFSARLDYSFTGESDISHAAYLVFNEPIHLNGNPSTLKLYTYGDESYNSIKARIRDSNNQIFNITLLGSINSTGWQQISSNIPENVKYPIFLERLYVLSPEGYDTATSGTLFFDNITSDISIAQLNVELPASTVFYDPLNINLGSSNIYGFDIAFTGNTNFQSDEKTPEYFDAIADVTRKLANGNQKIFLAGESDLSENLQVNTQIWTPTYNFSTHENVGIAQMTASKGGILSTNSHQWSRLISDIGSSRIDHVIIMFDKNPMNFNMRQEYELFQRTLLDISESGKSVFVISTEGTGSSNIVKDGVRYINLAKLFNDDLSVNANHKVLKFRISGDNIYYEFI